MKTKVLIAHAPGEERIATTLAEPLIRAGYDVWHEGMVLVGDSVVSEALNLLQQGAPIVLCGTVRAVGTPWARKLLGAARRHPGVRVFCVRVEEHADVESLSFDEVIAEFWSNSERAINQLTAAIQKYFPLTDSAINTQQLDLEEKYRDLALRSCDIIDLANLPEDDRHIVVRELELRRLFVSLRVDVHTNSKGDADDEILAGLEARRGLELTPGQSENKDSSRSSIGERLKISPRIVVLGDPGAGKSTLLRWLATAYLLRLKRDPNLGALPDVATLPEGDWIPVLIRCRDLDAGTGTLDEMLRQTLRKAEFSDNHCEQIRDLLRNRLSAGTALLLIDGLDELADHAARARFAQQIEQIHRAHPLAPVVVTCRIVGYREMGYRIRSGFEHVTLADLSSTDKDDFAKRWSELTVRHGSWQRAAQDLSNDIHSSDRIERLTGNPMLLTTMALIKRKLGRLPHRRVDLYEKAVEVLLNWRSAVDAAIDPKEALPQLKFLAYTMSTQGIQQMLEDEVLAVFAQARNEYPQIHAMQKRSPADFLALLERRTALLIQAGFRKHNGLSVPVYEFRHLTIQEYLAAMALIQGHFPSRDPNQSLADIVAPLPAMTNGTKTAIEPDESAISESWREPLRLCVAACNDHDVDSVINAIATPLPGESRTDRGRSALAVTCLADEPSVSEAVVLDVLRRFAGLIGDSDGASSTTFAIAVEQVAKSRWGFDVTSILLSEFSAREPSTRGDVGAVLSVALIALLPSTSSERIEWVHLQKSALLSGDDSYFVSAALSLMRLAFEGEDARYSETVEALIQRLNGPPHVAHSAMWALGWIAQRGDAWSPGEKEWSQFLAALDDPEFDPEAVRWLAHIVDIHGDSAKALSLLRHLARPFPKTQAAISGALATHSAFQASGALHLLLLEKPSDPELTRVIFNSLGRLKATDAARTIEAYARDADSTVRVAAIEALGAISNPDSVELLSAIARNRKEKNDTRCVAIDSLSNFDEREIVALLLRLSAQKRESNAIRRTAISALGRHPSELALNGLLRIATDVRQDRLVHREAHAALAGRSEPEALAASEAALNGSDTTISAAVFDAMIRRPENQSDRALLSRDFDGLPPFIGRGAQIDDARLNEAQAQLKLDREEIARRYRLLSNRFNLQICFA